MQENFNNKLLNLTSRLNSKFNQCQGHKLYTDLVEVDGLQGQLSQPLPPVSVRLRGRGYTPHSRLTASTVLEIHVRFFSFFTQLSNFHQQQYTYKMTTLKG